MTTARSVLLCVALLVGALPTVHAVDVTVPVYGVPASSEMSSGAAGWFITNQPAIFSRMVVGTVTLTIPDSTGAAGVAAIQAVSIFHAILVPQTMVSGTTYVITGYQVRRVETVTAPAGSLTTTVYFDAPTPAANLVLGGAPPATSSGPFGMMLYSIATPTVTSVLISDGFIFPTSSDGAAFRWTMAGLRQRGASDGTFLLVGSARVIPITAATTTPLSSFPGAYVQLKDPATGAYRYVLQSQIAPDDLSVYDPVLMDGKLILGGTSGPGIGGTSTARYTLSGTSNTGTFHPTDAIPSTLLPPALYAQASPTEDALPPPPPSPVIDTSVSRGVIPDVDETGAPTGKNVELFAGGQTANQSSATLLSDVQAQGANASAATPSDTITTGPDRVRTAVTGSGASGKSQAEAQASAAAFDYLGPISLAAGTATLTYGTNPDGSPKTETVSAPDLLGASDQDLNAQVVLKYDDLGQPIPPQKKPVTLTISGTAAQAQVLGNPDEIYAKADVVNAQIAPHLEGTTWIAANGPRHHGALINPIDYVDEWMIAQFGARTGVTTPDKGGTPVPGDGDNPYEPLPLGSAAGHPFYDFDDDGDLDRWYTDDPFDGGYKKMKILWQEEPGGSRELGKMSVHPSYNVCVVGIKKPRLSDAGVYATKEDLLLTVGHDLLPFTNRKMSLHGWKTFYAGGLITPLDPYSASDPTLYQLSVRNCTSYGTTGTGSDGADPSELIPVPQLGSRTVPMPGPGGTTINYTATYFANWYPGLVSAISSPPWTWTWSDPMFTLPAGVADQPGVPVVYQETLIAPDGTHVSTTHVSRPVYTDPDTGAVGGFDPSLIPVATTSPPSTTPLTNTYMWNYPQGQSTAEGGTVPADPLHWQFPWNLAFNGDDHSKRYTQQAFTLNSANMAYFPTYATQTPLITHQGLIDDASGGTPTVQWILRENADANPPGNLTDWINGLALYTAPGWAPGQPWIQPGRSFFHVPTWDGRTDIATRGVGGCVVSAGARLLDVVAGESEYVFLGRKYRPHTSGEQIALLRRMWNFYFTGYEFPAPGVTTLPSLAIPQRYNNWDLTSRPLNTATVPATSDPAVTENQSDANHAGNLAGTLVGPLANSIDYKASDRKATERRAKLMKEQIFLFSATRGREWELDMARRMPSSVRLICVEYDDKSAVKAILGVNGGNVFFPKVTSQIVTDNLGGQVEIETSNEVDILKEIAQSWFDPISPFIGYQGGMMGANNDYSLHDAPATGGANQMGMRTGSASTISKSLTAGYDGFSAHRLDGVGEGLAAYCFILRSLPLNPTRQWTPDPGQTTYSSLPVEFRHPMLLVYHDLASTIYVHYGRNADPDDVFGHWDSCATPPPSINITSSEFLRRQRYEAWQNQANLENIYNHLHPVDYSNYLASLVDIPPAPANPGVEPMLPTPPTPPLVSPAVPEPPASMPAPVWTQSRAAWGGLVGGTTGGNISALPDWANSFPLTVDLLSAHDQWLTQFPAGGSVTSVSPQTTTGGVNSGLTPTSSNPNAPLSGFTSASLGAITLDTPFTPNTLAVNVVSPRAAHRVATGLPITVNAKRTSASGYSYTTLVGGQPNWGLDPAGQYGYVLGDMRIGNAALINGTYPELAPSTGGVAAFPNIFASTRTSFVTFTLPSPSQVQLIAFVYDDVQVRLDNAEIDRTGGFPTDRVYTYTLAAGAHTFLVTTDGNGSGLGARGLMVRLQNPYALAKAIADADLAAYEAYQTNLLAWQQYQSYLTAFAKYLVDEAAYESAVSSYDAAHAAWVSAEATWNTWNTDNAALIALKAAATQFLQDRATWVSLAISAAGDSGVSWPGDEAVAMTQPDQFAAINPQLPIWQAYEWFISPANGVPEAIAPPVSP